MYEAMQELWAKISDIVFINGISNIILIIIAFLLFRKFADAIIEKFIRRVITREKGCSKKEEKQREDTLIGILVTTFNISIAIAAFLMVLQQLGIDITPLLAGVGILGLALGFGAQYLVRDFISGLFIIIENQYRVGDVVNLIGVSGTVEDISLRMTTLRDLNGTVHHIPHGEIRLVSNKSKYYARINLDIGVSYNSDLEHLISVINKVGQELADDPAWKDQIVEAPQFLRVNDFADSAIVIKILGKVESLKQWEVAGELRKRIKIAFDKEGIEIPFPQRVIHKG
jgi:small conductance mechanosensitive channel